MNTIQSTKTPTKRERRAAQLLAHYAACERLAKHLCVENRFRLLRDVPVETLGGKVYATIKAGTLVQCNNARELAWSIVTALEGEQKGLSDHVLVTCDLLQQEPRQFDGKRIAVALLKLEQDANNAATAQCNGAPYMGQPYRDEKQWADFCSDVRVRLAGVLGAVPTGFFVNTDPRGYALKIDNEDPRGKALIEAVEMHTDWGGYGILSPEITGA